jgi:hypothetical protein
MPRGKDVAPLLAAVLIITLLAGCAKAPSWPQSRTEPFQFDPGSGQAVLVIGQGVQQPGSLFGCPTFQTTWTGPNLMQANIIGCQNSSAGDVVYNVLVVSPGTYSLANTFHKVGNLSQTTRYEPDERISIEVAAGEVVYAGDFLFGRYYPARLTEIRRNDEGAKKRLADLKVNSDTLRYRAIKRPTRGAP